MGDGAIMSGFGAIIGLFRANIPSDWAIMSLFGAILPNLWANIRFD
jgi:hypothetical protein